MATRSEKAKLYNQLRSQGLSEGDAITQAGITDGDLDNYSFVINESGQMEPFDIGFGSGPDRAEINDAEPYTPRTIKPTQRAESTIANRPTEDSTSIQPLSTDPNVVITRTTTTTTIQNVQRSGGGSRTRTAAVYEDSPEGAQLRQQADEIENRRKALIEQKRAEGASVREALNDPEVESLKQERENILDQADQQKVEVTPPTDTFVEAPESNITTATQQKTIEREQAIQKANEAEQKKDPQDPAGQAEGVEDTGNELTDDERDRLEEQDQDEDLEDEPVSETDTSTSQTTATTDPVASDQSGETQPDVTGNVSSTSQQSITGVSSSADIDIAITTKKNPLRNYSSISYDVALYRIKSDMFNRISLGGEFQPDGDDLLISNSGTNRFTYVDSNLSKNPVFRGKAFHIDNINISSLVGLSGRNRNTNVTELSFTIYEPYGVSLVENLVRVAGAGKEGDYLDTPYMLAIKFLGYDENGVEITGDSAAQQVKHIPIRITDMRISVDSSGSNYEVTAVPYAHQAYDTIRNVVPYNIVVTASNVESFFNAKIGVLKNVSVEREDLVAIDRTRTVQKRSNFNGFAAAINNYHQNLVVQGYHSIADEYAFEFDEELASASFTLANILNIEENKVPMVQDNFDQFSKHLDGSIGYSETQKAFVINQGTSITELINLILRRSTYMTNQIDLNSDNQSTAIKWWKIIPRIELLGYDIKRKTHAKRVTFVVKYLPVNGRNLDGIGKQLPESVHKFYNYIYTGQNEDILDLSLDFNASYYYARSIVENFQQASPYVLPNDIDRSNVQNSTLPTQLFYHGSYETDAIINGNIEDVQIAGDITRQLLNNSVDMLELKLKIVGDPDYIDTTNYRIPGLDNNYGREVYLPDGGINYNARETYLELFLRTPTDYDPNTGEMDVNNSETSILVSGKYRVIEVTSTLSGGEFVQEIDAVKLPNTKNVVLSAEQVTNQIANNIVGDLFTSPPLRIQGTPQGITR